MYGSRERKRFWNTFENLPAITRAVLAGSIPEFSAHEANFFNKSLDSQLALRSPVAHETNDVAPVRDSLAVNEPPRKSILIRADLGFSGGEISSFTRCGLRYRSSKDYRFIDEIETELQKGDEEFQQDPHASSMSFATRLRAGIVLLPRCGLAGMPIGLQ
jgi:hypothetical protein